MLRAGSIPEGRFRFRLVKCLFAEHFVIGQMFRVSGWGFSYLHSLEECICRNPPTEDQRAGRRRFRCLGLRCCSAVRSAWRGRFSRGKGLQCHHDARGNMFECDAHGFSCEISSFLEGKGFEIVLASGGDAAACAVEAAEAVFHALGLCAGAGFGEGRREGPAPTCWFAGEFFGASDGCGVVV